MSGRTAKHRAAREMGSPRRARNRWRTRTGPEPAVCASTLFVGRGTRGEGERRRGEERSNVLPWYRLDGAVSTSSQTHKRGKAGLPVKRLSGRHVVRGRQSSPIPAQQPAVNGGSKGVHQGNRQGW